MQFENLNLSSLRIVKLLNVARKSLKNAPKGTAISKKYFKKSLEYTDKMISNGNDEYIYVKFLIYLLELCDYCSALLFLKDALKTYNFKNIKTKQELQEIYNNHNTIANYSKNVKIKKYNYASDLKMHGLKYWMKLRNFSIKCENDLMNEKKLNEEFINQDFASGLELAEFYEFFGEWKYAHNIYNAIMTQFYPVTMSDVEFMLKIKNGFNRCSNLNNYDKCHNIREYFSL